MFRFALRAIGISSVSVSFVSVSGTWNVCCLLRASRDWYLIGIGIIRIGIWHQVYCFFASRFARLESHRYRSVSGTWYDKFSLRASRDWYLIGIGIIRIGILYLVSVSGIDIRYRYQASVAVSVSGSGIIYLVSVSGIGGRYLVSAIGIWYQASKSGICITYR